jgi:hypothetical protein
MFAYFISHHDFDFVDGVLSELDLSSGRINRISRLVFRENGAVETVSLNQGLSLSVFEPSFECPIVFTGSTGF